MAKCDLQEAVQITPINIVGERGRGVAADVLNRIARGDLVAHGHPRPVLDGVASGTLTLIPAISTFVIVSISVATPFTFTVLSRSSSFCVQVALVAPSISVSVASVYTRFHW